MDAASVAASLAAAVVSPPAAAVVAVVPPPPPHPARDIAAMETASANDKVRFLIKLFLLHLLGHLVSLTTHFILLLYRRAEIFNSGQNCDSLWNPVNLYNFVPYF